MLLSLLLSAAAVRADWFDPAWPMRRAIDLPEDARANAIATVELYLPLARHADAADLRIADESGRVLPMTLLQVGPGDRVRVAFQPRGAGRRSYAYFGHDATDPPRDPEKLPLRGGLVWESRPFIDAMDGDDPQRYREAWEKSDAKPIGISFVDRFFIGMNPLGDNLRSVSRISGTIDVPTDGNYQFAVAADDRAAVFIDGRPLLVARMSNDVRFNRAMPLKKGPREVVIYHADVGGESRLVMVWRKPGDMQWMTIPPAALAPMPVVATAGRLERLKSPLIADFAVEYLDECFVYNAYSHRVRFTARPTLPERAKATYEWTFGDGTAATGETVEHVHLRDGVFDVTLRVTTPGGSDERTFCVPVARVFDRDAKTREIPPSAHANVLAERDLSALGGGDVANAVFVLERGGRADQMERALRALLAAASHASPERSAEALDVAIASLLSQKKLDAVVRSLEVVNAKSNLLGAIAERGADLMLWRVGDFRRAEQLLRSWSRGNDRDVKLLLGEALLLSGRGDEARKLIEQLQERDPPAKRVAISGAMARTVEFFVDQKDRAAGEAEWRRWMRRFPQDLLDGYAVLLRVRLVEPEFPSAAARVAESFARSMPDSAYAPQLLARAMRIQRTLDATKAAELKAWLKERYPESPEANE